MSPQTTIAFLGATGGCTNAALVLALNNGHQCVALARTPTKLTTMLLEAGVAQTSIDQQLTIVKGDIRSAADLQAVFSAKPIDLIVSGIGSYPAAGWDGTVCRDAASTIVEALRELKKADPSNSTRKVPAICMISTTGITSGARDVPLLMVPLYHALLRLPHKDKRAMEETVVDAYGAGGPDAPLSGFTFVRPTLLGSGEPKGMGAIRVGSEDKPQLGYMISRKDVGLWIYEEMIKGDASKWAGAKPSLTT